MKSICGLDCCDKCALKAEACSGCRETNGHPCGGSCMAADIITNKGFEAFTQLKHQIISEFNSLGIKDLSISDLNLLVIVAPDIPVRLPPISAKHLANGGRNPGRSARIHAPGDVLGRRSDVRIAQRLPFAESAGCKCWSESRGGYCHAAGRRMKLP